MRGRRIVVGACALALLVAGPASAKSTPLQVTSVSNPHPSLVSGGQVLLRVTAPASAVRHVKVTIGHRDVTKAFKAESATSLLGLVAGLKHGHSAVTATVGTKHATLTLDNHPITGPVFSGPQQKPFYCETTGYGLAAAKQPYCSAPSKVTYMYRTTAGAFQKLASPSQRPADLATTQIAGKTVPYIVRLERGVIDRAVYEIAALYDGHAPSWHTPDTSWNQRLVYTFGGGCNAGYHQGRGTGGVMEDLFLARGYAVASSSLNVLDNNCSPIISAEAAMMVKEHFIETYGPVAHTIGSGASGGAIQQYDIAEAYPGILDGILPQVSFPDPLSTGGVVTDCRLLDTLITAGTDLTAAQQLGVSGFNDYATCKSWDVTFASRATATDSCDSSIPQSARWNPATNPRGVKCESTEQLANQLGHDPQTGFIRSTLDNIGVQYGLAALQAGTITPAQFATLNATIGGNDQLGKPGPARSPADPKALDAAYADDIVNSASLGLPQTPTIDVRLDLDFAGMVGDIHTSEWSYVMRARLAAANHTSASQVIIENQTSSLLASGVYELGAMDRWLDRIDSDRSHRSLKAKVIADRPADLADGCYLTATQRVRAPLTDPATGPCAAMFPIASDTRLVAGQPLAITSLKCQLKPLDLAAYAPVTFTAQEQAQLQAAFPTGVCDYSKPGVGERAPIGVWLSYGDESSGLTKPTPISR